MIHCTTRLTSSSRSVLLIYASMIRASSTIKEAFDKAVDKTKDTVDNVKDAVSESGHRGAAKAEQTKRAVEGDQMSVTEKAGSMFNQAKETVQAKVDETKQDIRKNT